MWRVTRKTEMTERKKFEHVSSRPLPYTTKTGIRIGGAYEPPLQQLTHEGEFMQGVLLGAKHSVFPERRVIGLALYMAAMIALITSIAVVVNK